MGLGGCRRPFVPDHFHYRGVLLIWKIVGQGPTLPAIGVIGGCLDVFLFPLSFSLSLGDDFIVTKILSRGAVT